MAYSFVTCAGTEFAVDWDVIERLCMSYWQTHYQLRSSTTIRLSESSWYNPFSWSLPEIQTAEIDWDKVRDRARRACASDMVRYAYRASSSMPDIAREVKYQVEQTAVQRRAFTAMLKEVQSANITAMQEAEKDYTGLISLHGDAQGSAVGQHHRHARS